MGDTIPARVKAKTGTTAQWETVKNDFIPMKGEVVIYSDGVSGKPAIKVGDGTSKVGILPFISAQQADWTEEFSNKLSFIKNKPHSFSMHTESGDIDYVAITDTSPVVDGGGTVVALYNVPELSSVKNYIDNAVDDISADDVSYSDAEHQSYIGANNVGDALEYLDRAVSLAKEIYLVEVTLGSLTSGTSNKTAQQIYNAVTQQHKVPIVRTSFNGTYMTAELISVYNDPIDGYTAVFAYEDQGVNTYSYARMVIIGTGVNINWKDKYVAVGDNISLLNNNSGYITGANVPSNETDPTISAWAKAANKPTYDASEITYDDQDYGTDYKETDVGDILSYIWGNKADSVLAFEMNLSSPEYVIDASGKDITDALANNCARVVIYTTEYLPDNKPLFFQVSSWYVDANDKYHLLCYAAQGDKVYSIELESNNGDTQVSGVIVYVQIPQSMGDFYDSGYWVQKSELKDATARTAAIPFAKVDGTSTSTAFTATVPEITALKSGVAVYLMNGVVTSASGWTLDVNGLGAKPVYQTMAAASATTTLFNINYTMLFVFNEERIAGGCWDIYYGYNSNDNTIAYNMRDGQTYVAKSAIYRYEILFVERSTGKLIPSNSTSNKPTTYTKTITTLAWDPFRPIFYYAYTTTIAADASPSASYVWKQYASVDLRYGFNINSGGASALTAKQPVYIRCVPQADKTVKCDGNDCITQTLPSTADGKVYVYLGMAYSAYQINLTLEHPVYYYDGTAAAVLPWT